MLHQQFARFLSEKLADERKASRDCGCVCGMRKHRHNFSLIIFVFMRYFELYLWSGKQ